MTATGTHTTTEEVSIAMFSVRSLPGLYNEGQLPLEKGLETAVRSVEWPPAWDLAVGQSPAGKIANTEVEYIVGTRHQATTGEDSAD
jgi:hypothetical protein